MLQISYKDRKEADGSVRPDWCIGTVCSVEVKNYDIHTNRSSLINSIVTQAKERKNHLPEGMTQKILIDLRRQSYSNKDLFDIKNQIEKSSNGIISKETINFIENQ